jgi:hypothetical protein
MKLPILARPRNRHRPWIGLYLGVVSCSTFIQGSEELALGSHSYLHPLYKVSHYKSSKLLHLTYTV